MQIKNLDKIDSHVKFFERFAAFYVLNFGDIVECHVEILKLFELRQILHFFNDIVLEIEDFEMTAVDIQIFYFDKFLLMEGYFF